MSEDIQKLIEKFERVARGRADQIGNINAAIDAVDKALSRSIVCPFSFTAVHRDLEGDTQENTFCWDGSHVCISRGSWDMPDDTALKQLSLSERLTFYPVLVDAVKVATTHVSREAKMFADVAYTANTGGGFDYGPPPSDDDVPF